MGCILPATNRSKDGIWRWQNYRIFNQFKWNVHSILVDPITLAQLNIHQGGLIGKSWAYWIIQPVWCSYLLVELPYMSSWTWILHASIWVCMITYGSTYGNPAIHQSAEGFPGSSIVWINMSHLWNRVRHIQDRVYHKPTISAYNSLACHNNGFAPSKQKPNATLQGICPSDSRGCRIHAVGANLVEMAIKMQNSKFCPVYPNWRKKKHESFVWISNVG